MANFISNVKEVDHLSDIYAAVAPPGPGRKHKVAVLHKSGIVLLVACWEAFVEDLAGNGLAFVIQHAPDHSLIPEDVRERIANRLQGKRAWDLAGDGWKQACRDHLKEVLARTIGNLNTPKTAQVDEVFEKVLGLRQISSKWSWRGRSTRATNNALDELVSLRGSIAHRVSAARNVRKSDVAEAREFLSRLAVKSHNAVNRHIASILGDPPWEKFWFEETQ